MWHVGPTWRVEPSLRWCVTSSVVLDPATRRRRRVVRHPRGKRAREADALPTELLPPGGRRHCTGRAAAQPRHPGQPVSARRRPCPGGRRGSYASSGPGPRRPASGSTARARGAGSGGRTPALCDRRGPGERPQLLAEHLHDRVAVIGPPERDAVHHDLDAGPSALRGSAKRRHGARDQVALPARPLVAQLSLEQARAGGSGPAPSAPRAEGIAEVAERGPARRRGAPARGGHRGGAGRRDPARAATARRRSPGADPGGSGAGPSPRPGGRTSPPPRRRSGRTGFVHSKP